jgi:hypothetical protein
VIRINVHPAGENPTNTIRTLPTPVHVRPTYASCRRSPYVATFLESSTEWSRPTASEKKGSWHNPQHAGWPICGSVPSFSPETTNEVVGAKPSIYQWPATRLTGIISPACDRYVQYLLTGANPSVLNWHRRGLQSWRCQLSTHHSLTFPTTCLLFPLKAPPDLRLSKQYLPTKLEREQVLNLVSGSLHSTSTVTYHLSIAWANDVSPRWS